MSLLLQLARHSRGVLLIALLTSLISGFGNAGLVALMNQALGAPRAQLGDLGLQFLVLGIVVLLTRTLSQTLFMYLGQRAKASLRMRTIRRIGEASYRHLEQQGAARSISVLTGDLDQIPTVIRNVGALLHREARAETLATYFEALLALPETEGAHPKVIYARGADGLTVTVPDTDVTAVLKRLGWKVLAPDGPGPTFRQSSIEAIRALDPDILIFSDPAMPETIKHNEAWQTVRAVREGHVHFAPSLPFGWVEEPPSINRLLGLAWLGGHEPATLAATFNAVVYGRALTPPQLDAVLGGVRAIQP